MTLIDGVGKALEKKLFALGIYKFSQIAKWTKDQQVWIGNEIGAPGRPERENWVRDAKALAGWWNNFEHAKKVERGAAENKSKILRLSTLRHVQADTHRQNTGAVNAAPVSNPWLGSIAAR